MNLQNNQSWQSHISVGKNAIVPAVKRKLGALYHLRNQIPWKSRRILANSIIVGGLIYGIPLWGGASGKLLRQAQSTLNWGARFVTRAHKKTRSIELMVRCNWLNVKELILFHSLLQFWKILKWETPIFMFREYTIGENWKVETIAPRLQLSDNCYLWRITPQWNALSKELRNIPKISIFKKALRQEIIDRRLRIDSEIEIEPD